MSKKYDGGIVGGVNGSGGGAASVSAIWRQAARSGMLAAKHRGGVAAWRGG